MSIDSAFAITEPGDTCGLSTSCEVDGHAWNALFDEGKSCLVLPHRTSDIANDIQDMTNGPDLAIRLMGQEGDLSAKIADRFPEAFAAYMTELLEVYASFMGADIMRIRLETVRTRACWKWHRDYTTLRLITTLRGQGTEYLVDPSYPETISRCTAGDIGLFKGRLFGDHFSLPGHEACVHRSPPWDDTVDPRLLLVIDTPQDFEIDFGSSS